MPYLTRAGANVGNLSGLESRGYHVYRRGTRVRVVWGPIDFPRTRTVSVVWTRATLYKDYRRSSPKAAVALLRQIVRKRVDEGYSKLPAGCRITPARYGSGVTRRS